MYKELIQEYGQANSTIGPITSEEAIKIEHQMACNGFDFSEASNLQFKSGIMDAKIDLGLEEMSDDALEALYMSL
tara:strand:- start:143 stop:367 length:225 start_codon:yes stop_codon:yes gene_type:complete